jgi:peroxiredoxin 2/4
MSEDVLHPPLLHDPAPDFIARTTLGERRLSDYRGRWLVLFSHPADFTPVCTSEFLAFAREQDGFAALNCDLLALSVDSLFSHLAWVRDIKQRFGVSIEFPIVEDPSMAVAKAYGMLPPGAPDSMMVRAVFVIDPGGLIRSITWYPSSIGRNVAELKRLVTALQLSDREGVQTPEGWRPGDDILLPPSMDLADEGDKDGGWYFRRRPTSP